MGRRGPPKTPTKLTVLRGNPGKRPINKREPKPDGVPTCPPELSLRARAEWRRMSKALIKLGLLTEIDMAALAAYCMLWADVIDNELAIREYGRTYISPTGQLHQRPEVAMRAKALAAMKVYIGEFGMTPSARTHLETGAPSVGMDDLERMLGS
jgi:P27 family predicted phage terminase small subunit